ncbi:MAG: hypothetical protein KJ949_00845 [Nanoarchaeota archaeon]|nr:hypothetical protein [Nanoarchaeota archaeon]
MIEVDRIKSEIERRVKEGDVEIGEIIRIQNLSKDIFIPLRACYAMDKNYETQGENIINGIDLNVKKYDLYLKYLGGVSNA